MVGYCFTFVSFIRKRPGELMYLFYILDIVFLFFLLLLFLLLFLLLSVLFLFIVSRFLHLLFRLASDLFTPFSFLIITFGLTHVFIYMILFSFFSVSFFFFFLSIFILQVMTRCCLSITVY